MNIFNKNYWVTTSKDEDGYEETKPKMVKIVFHAFLFIFIAVVLLTQFPIITVQAGHVGVITRFGAVNRVVSPGISFRIPFVEGVVDMETRTQKDQVEAQAASKDLQEVKSTIALNYHLDSLKAVDVYQNLGADYNVRVIAPAIQEAFKATTAQFTAEELIVKRAEVKQVALDELKKRLAHLSILVDDFNIVNFDFSPEFNAAIEQKQVAQQNVETEKRKLESIQVQAQQAKAQAQGQADAQKALRETGALSPEYLQYLALTKWNGILPTVTGGAIPFVNIK